MKLPRVSFIGMGIEFVGICLVVWHLMDANVPVLILGILLMVIGVTLLLLGIAALVRKTKAAATSYQPPTTLGHDGPAPPSV
ncbi:MAG: hypothetical protein ACTII7_03130 [Galactobacter sp.]